MTIDKSGSTIKLYLKSVALFQPDSDLSRPAWQIQLIAQRGKLSRSPSVANYQLKLVESNLPDNIERNLDKTVL